MLCMDGSDGFVLLVSSSLLVPSLLLVVEDSFNFKVDVDFGMLEQSCCLASVILLLFASSSCVSRLFSFLLEYLGG